MGRQWILFAAMLFLLGLATACGDGRQTDTTAAENPQPSAAISRELPTLYPSATPYPTPSPANTRPPQPTSTAGTEVAFDQLAVDVRYSIPILGLDRRIRGNVAGEIEVIDLSNGNSLTLKNRPGVVVEMQQSLPKATIEPLDPNCEACAQVSYELPMTEQSDQGWLNDVQMLASLETFTASALGPHFPPNTIIGLRRDATPFEVAHSAAVTADGELWAWTATESQVEAPIIVEGIGSRTEASLGLVDLVSLPPVIGQTCYQGGGRELLMLADPDEPRIVDIRCPQLYLPGQLLPLYLLLNEAVEDKLAGAEVDPPDLPMSLESLVVYRRSDGAGLTVAQNGQLSAVNAEGATFTSTVSTTLVISLTTALASSELLQPGPAAIFEQGPGNVILFRANDGVYEFAWQEDDEPPSSLMETWDDLLDSLLQGGNPLERETPLPSPTASESDDS